MEFEKKTIPFEVKADSVTDEGFFKGHGAAFNNVDLGDDIIEPGAFTKTLKKNGRNVKMLWQHDSHQPIGIWPVLAEDKKGLAVEGQLLLELTTLPAKDAHILLRNKAIGGLSIGFRTKKSLFDRETGIRHLQELELREISLVTFPMNLRATVTSVKAISNIDNKRDLESYLREAGISRSEAKFIVSRHDFQRDVENDDAVYTNILNDIKELNRRF